MKGTKIVKARCRRTGAAFGIEVKQFGAAWKAVDFVKLTDKQDAMLESQVDVERLVAADNLQACPVCHQRAVGGCGCAAGSACRKNDPYRYSCMFCRELRLDYDDAVDGREGETITLSQGQVIKLTRRGTGISKILVGMGWKPSKTSDNLDLDSSVVMLEADGRIRELVYFGHRTDADGSVVHHGDNLYGSEKINGENDDENISVNLSLVPQSVRCLAFIVNIYSASARHQTLGGVEGMHIRLIEDTTKNVLAKYSAFAQNRSSTGLIIGAAYRSNGAWKFAAMGDCYRIDDVQELADISCARCRDLLQGGQ